MAALDVQVLARLARSALRQKDAYAYMRVAPLLAQAFPSEREWLAGYVQSLIRLGLFAAAQEVVDQLGAESCSAVDFESLRATASGLLGGRIPWASRKRRFQANLAVLAQRDLAAARAVEQAWVEDQTALELHQSSDGNVHVKRAGAVWPPAWLPFLDDHKAHAAARLALPRQGLLPAPLVFDGLALGWEFLEGYAATQKVFLDASSTLYVIQRNPEALAVLLHVHDWRDYLQDPRVVWFVGEQAMAAFRARLEADTAWPLTDRVYGLPLDGPDETAAVHAAMAAVALRRSQQVQELRSAIESRYAGRDEAWWAERFASAADASGRAFGRPLRILALTSRHTTFLQYSMRDCIKALERLGHQTRLVIEPSAHQPLDPVSTLQAQMEFEPDLILLLSRMRYEMTGFLHPSIPSLTWDQDQLPWVFDPARKPQLAWNDFLMGFAAGSAPRRFGWPAHRCRYCAMAGSADTYLADPLPESELAAYRCDVSYVSHASATVEEECRSVESWLPDGKLRALFREVRPPLLDYWNRGGEFPAPIMTPLIDLCEQKGWPWTVEELGRVTQVIQRLGDRAFRHVALSWVADWAERTGRTFHLYGNGWDRHPRLAQYARGPTKNGEELRRIYQASAINLQLMAFGFLHQRALDGLMAGGFFMTRRSGSDSDGLLMRRLVALLDQAQVRTRADLLALRDGPTRCAIESAIREWSGDPRGLTPQTIDIIRTAAMVPCAQEVLPGFESIGFGTAAEFESRAEAFIRDEARRRLLAARIRQAVFEGFSYDARMREMIDFLGTAFQTQSRPAAGGHAAPIPPFQAPREGVPIPWASFKRTS